MPKDDFDIVLPFGAGQVQTGDDIGGIVARRCLKGGGDFIR